MIHNHPIMQVHLDFHTSPDIKGIGSNFSKENFQAALKEGNTESITVFAKCHHGVCYYPTDVGTKHPNIDFDLTGAMIDAAHEIGVRAPIYITAGWSHHDAINHPEWRAKDINGEYIGSVDALAEDTEPKPECSWYNMCLNDGEYAEHIYAITEEICKRYKTVDGLFYDICFIGNACYCDSCKKGMREMGMDPDNEDNAKKYYIIKHQAFLSKCSEIMRKYYPDATIFFNSGGADRLRPEYHKHSTHFEMEDLPTCWGGYDKLALRARYFANKGKPYTGLTGKFHLAWGEFGGFKTKEALKYEIAMMALYGAGASVGDHMHPDGEMELETYRNIGYAYRYLKKIAPFCYGGKPVVNVGICLSDNTEACEGVSDILIENQIDYGIVYENNFEEFDTVIISEGVVLDNDALCALKSYINNGGKLVLMADALVKDNEFQLDFGVKYLGVAEYDTDYIIPLYENEQLANAPILCNIPAHRTEAVKGEVYAKAIPPYFSRTYGHFCGHKNTPYNKQAKCYPAIVKSGNVVYMAHSLPRQYYKYGSVFHKRYFMFALGLVYGGSLLEVCGLGSQGRCTMIEQTDKNRYCINMTYASPVSRGEAMIIEDIMPVYSIRCRLKTNRLIKRVYLGLTDEDLVFTQNNGEVKFTVPELECHTSIIVDY